MTFTPFGGVRNCGFCKYLIYIFKLNNTMNKKTFYEAPEAELLIVKIEENFLTSDPNAVRSNSASSGYNGEYDMDEI